MPNKHCGICNKLFEVFADSELPSVCPNCFKERYFRCSRCQKIVSKAGGQRKYCYDCADQVKELPKKQLKWTNLAVSPSVLSKEETFFLKKLNEESCYVIKLSKDKYIKYWPKIFVAKPLYVYGLQDKHKKDFIVPKGYRNALEKVLKSQKISLKIFESKEPYKIGVALHVRKQFGPRILNFVEEVSKCVE